MAASLPETNRDAHGIFAGRDPFELASRLDFLLGNAVTHILSAPSGNGRMKDLMQARTSLCIRTARGISLGLDPVALELAEHFVCGLDAAGEKELADALFAISREDIGGAKDSLTRLIRRERGAAGDVPHQSGPAVREGCCAGAAGRGKAGPLPERDYLEVTDLLSELDFVVGSAVRNVLLAPLAGDRRKERLEAARRLLCFEAERKRSFRDLCSAFWSHIRDEHFGPCPGRYLFFGLITAEKKDRSVSGRTAGWDLFYPFEDALDAAGEEQLSEVLSRISLDNFSDAAELLGQLSGAGGGALAGEAVRPRGS